MIKFYIFIVLLFLVHCASEPIVLGEGNWEEPLTKASGITSEQYNLAKSKESLNLLDIYALSLKSNERIAMRYEKVRQAEAKKSAAFAMFLPSLNYRNQLSRFYPYDPNARRFEQERRFGYDSLGLPSELYPLVSRGGGAGGNLPPNIRSGHRLNLHIPIFTGLQEYTGYKSAKSEILLRQWEMSQESRLLFTDIAHNYYSIVLLEKAIEQKKEIQKVTKNILSEYNRRVYLGLARASELSTFQTRLATFDAELFSLEEQLNAGKERIAFLANMNFEIAVQDDLVFDSPTYDLESALDTLGQRPDVRAAATNVDLSKQKELGVKGEFLPNVYVDGLYNFKQGNSPESGFVQFVFEVPIFAGGRTLAAIKEAESLKRESELNLSYIIRMAKEEIRKCFFAFQSSGKELEAYRKALDLAERGHRLIIQDFRLKQVTSLDVLNSLTNLNLARDGYERARIQHKLNRLLLGIAVGEFPRGAKNWEMKKERKDDSG
jgi:outer membrane protein